MRLLRNWGGRNRWVDEISTVAEGFGKTNCSLQSSCFFKFAWFSNLILNVSRAFSKVTLGLEAGHGCLPNLGHLCPYFSRTTFKTTIHSFITSRLTATLIWLAFILPSTLFSFRKTMLLVFYIAVVNRLTPYFVTSIHFLLKPVPI